MKRRTLEVDHWRHFMPLAPDIDIQVESGAVSYHTLEKDVIIQGARDPSTHESPSVDISKTPLQRGWRLTLVPITVPMQGNVKATIDGFRYDVPSQFQGQDCFNYILTNGTQESNVATVTLTVVQGYQYNFGVNHKYNDAYEVEIKGLFPTELPKPEHELFRWYLTAPQLVTNKELGGRKQVEYVRRLVDYYTISGYRDSEGRYISFVKYNPTTLSRSFPDDLACEGFPIGDTDVLYEAKGDRGQLEVEVLFYYGKLLQSESRKFTVTPEAIFGKRWWDSGNREGQKPPVPNVSKASATNLGSQDAINDLLSTVESNVEGSVPNQFARLLVKDASKAIGSTTGAEMSDALALVNANGGDMATLLQSMLDKGVIDILEDLQG